MVISLLLAAAATPILDFVAQDPDLSRFQSSIFSAFCRFDNFDRSDSLLHFLSTDLTVARDTARSTVAQCKFGAVHLPPQLVVLT